MTMDMSQLPLPDVIETLSFEAIYERRLGTYLAELGDDAPQEIRDSDPSIKLIQVASYEEMTLRARINDAARKVMLASSSGTTLDQLLAFFGVLRQQVEPGDPNAFPPVAAVYESDDDFKARGQLAPEGFAAAGPAGAYRFHTRSASALVKDVAVDAPQFSHAELPPEIAALLPAGVIVLQVDYAAGLDSPMPGDVAITILSREADGTPTADLIEQVGAALNDEDVRPLTDRPRVAGAEILAYSVAARLVMYPGPAPEPVLAAAQEAAQRYTDNMHRLGYDVTEDGLHAALRQPGVQRVFLEGWQDIICGPRQAAKCVGISLTVEDETDV